MRVQVALYLKFLLKKIRIGYVLKSADVGTLFSRRNSENSSLTHAHTHAHPHPPTHTHAHPPVPIHTHPRRPASTHAHPPVHTCTHPHTPHTYPLMPADALNLINHMKLHVQVALTLCGFTLCVSHFVRGLQILQKISHCAIFSHFPHFVLIFMLYF